MRQFLTVLTIMVIGLVSFSTGPVQAWSPGAEPTHGPAATPETWHAALDANGNPIPGGDGFFALDNPLRVNLWIPGRKNSILFNITIEQITWPGGEIDEFWVGTYTVGTTIWKVVISSNDDAPPAFKVVVSKSVDGAPAVVVSTFYCN